MAVRILALFLSTAFLMQAESAKAYWASLAAVTAAHVADMSSSYGKQELNPLLAGRNGRFDASSVMKKSLVVGALDIAQIYAVHKNPRHKRWMTIANYSVAAGLTFIAARNYRIQPVR